jgi:uncharacterized caspase-like protein
MGRLLFAAIAASVAFFCAASFEPAFADLRVALVIGNSNYRNAPLLRNPTGDAKAIETKFREAGFDVVTLNDVDNLQFKRGIRQFEAEAANADIAAVYYAGHGIEIGGVNYLIPVDAKLDSDRDAEDEAITLDRLVDSTDRAGLLRLIIIDACRDNPFLRTMKQTATRGLAAGLGRIQPSAGNTLIAYAAKAGSIAMDGAGDHSPYAVALLNNLFVPGLDVRFAFGRIRDDVLKMTSNRQEPFVYGSLSGQSIALVPAAVQSGPSVAANDAAKVDYALVEKVDTKAAWELFLGQHPQGFLADLARARLAKIANEQTQQNGAPDRSNRVAPTRDLQLQGHDSNLPPATFLWWWPQWR